MTNSRGELVNIETSPKKSGDQTGTTIDFAYRAATSDESKNIKFYVKTHQNFKIASTTAQAVAISGDGEQIDYKELMIYEILEYTKFGPKCSFCSHPFARGAILIATQAADFTKTHSVDRKKFVEGSKLQDLSGTFHEKDTTDLNGIDLIARILNITDLNGDNYGRVTVANAAAEVQKNKWKIIDFRILDSRDNSMGIYEDFINTTNNKSFVVEGGFAYRLVKLSAREQKQQIAEQLVQSLDQKFFEAVDKALMDVIEFLEKEENRRYLGLKEESIARIIDDLSSYSETVKTNYNAFKEAVLQNQQENIRK